MKSSWVFVRFLAVFLVFFSLIASMTVQGFTGTYGINYGRIADNIPSPDEVATLLRAAKIKNVRIYDADHSVLKAFSGTGLELVVGLPNGSVKNMSSSEDHAMSWVKENVQSFLPETQIRGIAVGNEVFGGGDSELWAALGGAVKNIYSAINKLHLADVVQITTAHSQAVFANSYPPSSCIFKDNIVQYMKPLLEFFAQIDSPFCLNAYPFLDYTYDPENIDINYALFQPTQGIYDPKTELHYDNMLDAQIDAAYAALADAGFKNMEVIVTETGWASNGDDSEAAATVDNARTYNYNLRKRLAKKKGTPFRPKRVVKGYVFAIFNENLKPGATSERNFGLFKPDGSIAYDIGFHGLVSSAADTSHLSLKVRVPEHMIKLICFNANVLGIMFAQSKSFLYVLFENRQTFIRGYLGKTFLLKYNYEQKGKKSNLVSFPHLTLYLLSSCWTGFLFMFFYLREYTHEEISWG